MATEARTKRELEDAVMVNIKGLPDADKIVRIHVFPLFGSHEETWGATPVLDLSMGLAPEACISVQRTVANLRSVYRLQD